MDSDLSREDIFNIVRDSLKEIAEINNIALVDEISEKTPLYGEKGILDSVSLVGLVVSIEEKLSEMNYYVTIASERAFSRKINPFLNIRTLINFIEELLDNVNK